MHCPRVLTVTYAHWMEKHTSLRTQKVFLRLLMAFERLSRLPTRSLTGYFVSRQGQETLKRPGLGKLNCGNLVFHVDGIERYKEARKNLRSLKMEIDKTIKGRRSIRRYQDRDIPDSVIKELLSLAI